MENIFVTVGTTEFNSLIYKLFDLETIKTLKKIGCRKLTIQAGSFSGNLNNQLTHIDIEIFDYKASIIDYIKQADFVIGHSGAGTVLDVLRCGKPLLVVTNETLMDNHQTELAEKLTKEGYLASCTVDQLCFALNNFDSKSIKPFPEPNLNIFPNFLDKIFEF